MMVAVLAYIVEIIVFAAGTNAFLRVDSTLELGEVGARIYGAEEDGLELVHSGIGEEKCRIRERDH